MTDNGRLYSVRKALLGLSFIILAGFLFCTLSYIVQPVYYGYNNYDTVHGFYEEPEETIEVLFLGASHTIQGVIPIELYEKFGICAYNIGTEQQPVLASYYWLKEIYERHSRSLKTVVFDPMRLFYPPDEAFSQKALDGMRFSENKVNAWMDYGGEADVLSRLVPLLSYHRRWSTLNQTDFHKQNHEVQRYNRGYWLQTSCVIQEKGIYDTPLLLSFLDEAASLQPFNEDSLAEFTKIEEFCREHDLELIVSKIPTFNWGSSHHNSVIQLLDDEATFLDFNFEPLLDELALSPGLDFCDIWHLNYYGAVKFTDWIGNYLIQNGLATDIRGQEKYAFMEDQLREWHENVTIPEPEINEEYLRLYNHRCENARIESYLNVTGGNNDLGAYLNAYWNLDSRVILISKCGEISALDDASREKLEALGLNKLSGLGEKDNYVGVVDAGEVYAEITASRYEPASIEGIDYKITSSYVPESTSIRINGNEYFGGTSGLSVVIYDKELNAVVSQAVFS